MSQNPELHYYSLGSPPPTIACPFCRRYFKTKSGRTRHIQAKHPADSSEPLAPDTAAPPSPVPSHFAPSLPPSCGNSDGFNADMDIASPISSLPQPSFHNPSPAPSHSAPSFPPSFNADMDTASPILSSPQPSFHHPSPVPSRSALSFPPSCDRFNADMDIAPPILSPQPSFRYLSPVPSHSESAPSLPPSCGDGFDIASPMSSSAQSSFYDISPVPSPIPDPSPVPDTSPIPGTSRITRTFHPKLDGMPIFFFLKLYTSTLTCTFFRPDLRRKWAWLTT